MMQAEFRENGQQLEMSLGHEDLQVFIEALRAMRDGVGDFDALGAYFWPIRDWVEQFDGGKRFLDMGCELGGLDGESFVCSRCADSQGIHARPIGPVALA